MKWAYYIKYKIRTVCFLAGILAVILAGNFWDRQSVHSLDTSMASILHDRLKPSAYIYEISNKLYEKRLLLNPATAGVSDPAVRQRNNKAISGLISSYESTTLTMEEKKEWKLFKNHLSHYNTLEEELLQAAPDNKDLSLIDQQFKLTLAHLDNLSKIQIGEGTFLFKNSQSVVNDTLMVSQLEIAILIILGLFTLILLSVSDKSLFKQTQQQLWN